MAVLSSRNRLIEFGIVESCGHDSLHVARGCDPGDQRLHQKARDRGIAVRESEIISTLPVREPEPSETRVAAPQSAPTREGIDADGPVGVTPCQIRKRIRVHICRLEQEFPIGDTA